MIRSWIIYIILLVADILLWLTIDGYVYYFLFRVMLILPVISFILFMIGTRKLMLSLSEQETHVNVSILSKLPSAFCSQLILKGIWKNTFYGVLETAEVTFSENEIVIKRPDLGSGYYTFKVQSVQCYDLLHMFRYNYKCDYEIGEYCYPQPIALREDALQLLQSKKVKLKNAEMDTNYEIKEYQEGEIPSHIHYPSSNRFQKLMLKKFDTMHDSRIQMQICFPEDREECELLLAVCESLFQKANEKTTFYVSWKNEQKAYKVSIQHSVDAKKFFSTCLAMEKDSGYSINTEEMVTLDSSLCHRLLREVRV